MLFLIVVISIIIVIALMLYFKYQSDNQAVTRTYDYTKEEPMRARLPKISAEVDDKLYREAKSYCDTHHLTMSDLIRKAIKEYIDSN